MAGSSPSHGLVFVGRDDCAITQLTRFNIGANDIAGLVLLVGLNGCLIESDLGLHLPGNGLERRLGAWPPFTLIAFVFKQMVRVDVMIAPRLDSPSPERLARRQGSQSVWLASERVAS